MLQIQQIAHHRNGVGGIGFYAVLFRETRNGPLFVASVFPEPGAVSVLRVGDLADPDVGVTFGANSWRGDVFETALRAAIREHSIGEWMRLGRSRAEAEELADS